MPIRLIDASNKTVEMHHPEVEDGTRQIDFDGQTYQLSNNPACKHVLPNGVAIRENVKIDNATSGIERTESVEARS